MEQDISTPQVAEPPKVSFGRRLRNALESLGEGEKITIHTKAERQQITNIVSAVQKKTGNLYTTKLMVRRADDPDGKIAIQITRLVRE